MLLGLAFLVFGLSGFFNFLPAPPPSEIPAGALSFGAALAQTGYMFQLIKGTEVACGLLLLANRFVPLALVILAPVLVNIIAFHIFLAPSGIVPGLVLVALEVALALSHREAFALLLKARAR